MNTRAGYFRQNLTGELAYSSFVPSSLPPNPPVVLDAEGVELLVAAHRQLALLEGLAARIPNMELFVSMYVRKEALLSSQIEGTQATLEDVLDPLVDVNANRDVADVVNYIRTTEFALRRRRELPLCSRLIREMHGVLMEGVRGQEKYPGEFRRTQNWIGGTGSTLKNARYIPPNVEDMNAAMSALEAYMNAEDTLDPLIRTALVHYQFETIHPFLDGNGRIGRLLITLFLMEQNLQVLRIRINPCFADLRLLLQDPLFDQYRNGTRDGVIGCSQYLGSLFHFDQGMCFEVGKEFCQCGTLLFIRPIREHGHILFMKRMQIVDRRYSIRC